jgi:hypothetical protein
MVPANNLPIKNQADRRISDGAVVRQNARCYPGYKHEFGMRVTGCTREMQLPGERREMSLAAEGDPDVECGVHRTGLLRCLYACEACDADGPQTQRTDRSVSRR